VGGIAGSRLPEESLGLGASFQGRSSGRWAACGCLDHAVHQVVEGVQSKLLIVELQIERKSKSEAYTVINNVSYYYTYQYSITRAIWFKYLSDFLGNSLHLAQKILVTN